MRFLRKLYKGIKVGIKVTAKLDALGIVDVNEAKIAAKIIETVENEKDADDLRDRLRESGNVFTGGAGPGDFRSPGK